MDVSEFTNYFTYFTFNDKNFNLFLDFNNLKEIKIYDVLNEKINLQNLYNLESITVNDCSNLAISDCKNLKKIYLENLENFRIDKIKCLDNLTLINVTTIYIEVDKIKELNLYLHEYEKVNDFTIKTKIIENFLIDYYMIKIHQLLLRKNKFLINNLIINDFEGSLYDLEFLNDKSLIIVKEIIFNINFDDSQIVLNLSASSLQHFIKFNIYNKKLISIEKYKNNYMVIDNIKNCKIISLDFNEEKELSSVNFYSLKEININNAISIVNFSKLINLRICFISGQLENLNCMNFTYLKELHIAFKKNLNINFNNLPKLKIIELNGCENISLNLQKQMQLTEIRLYELKKVNINFKLNCPKLSYFYFSYIPDMDNSINIEFFNTPMLIFKN
ncbi:hypothetical protein ABK040_009763 [Willaertia magna]